MKQVLMDGGKPVLPEDIIRNILKRLPVKNLIRSQCVCKHWKILIKTPSFIAEHIQHNAHQNPSLLFLGRGGLFYHSVWYFLNHEMQAVKVRSGPLDGSFYGSRIIGSINGLICFQPNYSSIFLLNPATRELRRVYEAINNSSELWKVRTGFGFSSMISDYKVVRIHDSMSNKRVVIRSKDRSSFTNRVNQVHIYSLSTGSWKEIELGNIDGVSFMSHGFPANGAIYWFGSMPSVGEQDENDGRSVISFDIATEVFTLIPLPSSVPKSFSNALAVYENKLVIICHTWIGNYEFSSIDLWVMEEGTGASGRWNWTKKYSSSPYLGLLRPGTILRNQIVCDLKVTHETSHEVKYGERLVVLINITTNEIKRFAIPKEEEGALFFNYAESLVSIGSNQFEEF